MMALAAGAAGDECPSCVRIPDGQLGVYTEGLPLSIWTDSEFYDRGSTVSVGGHLRPENSGHPVTLTVTGPTGNLVDVAQVEPDQDGGFGARFEASGRFWKMDGPYVIEARSGPDSRVFRTQVQLVPGELGESSSCSPSQARVSADNGGIYCVDYWATGEVTGAEGFLSVEKKTLSLDVRGPGAGELWIKIPRYLLDSKEGGEDAPFGVFSGGEPAAHSEEPGAEHRTLRVPYGPDLERRIEVAGTSAVPEFGAALAAAAAGSGAAALAGRLRASKQ